jgi:hypothetical protein
MISNLKIELNGVLVRGRIEGVDSFLITLREKDEDRFLSKSFSSELTFYDDGFDILAPIILNNSNGFANKVTVKIYDDCCSDPVFTGLILGDSIDWCEPGCSITANIIEENDAFNCFRSTLIADNFDGFLSRDFVPLRYCIESRPQFMQVVLIWLAYLLNQIFYLILIPWVIAIFFLLGIVNILCNIVVVICRFKLRFKILRWTVQIGPICSPPDCSGAFTNPLTLIGLVTDLFKEINEELIPCGRYHPSPYVRDYVNNVCKKCGLTFQSSILNNPSSPYFNTLLVSAQVDRGRKKSSSNFRLIENNIPVETLESLIEEYLIPLFNADYSINSGILIFERRDFFQLSSTWIDTEDLLNKGLILEDKVCFSWIEKERYSFGQFEYQSDAQDYIGNEAKSRWNDIVEWNIPFSTTQKGVFRLPLPVSPARFRQDGIDADLFSRFESALGGVVNVIFFGAFSSYNRAMLINQHTFFNYKFLIHNPDSGTNGYIQNFYSDSFCGGNPGPVPEERYNYPFWFDEGYQNNLYSNFYAIEDPRLPGSSNFNFSFTFLFDCDNLRTIAFDKAVRLNRGGLSISGKIQELEIDFNARTMKVSGIC